MSDNTFIEKLKAVRADALDILRQAGFIMSLQAGTPLCPDNLRFHQSVVSRR